MKEWGREGGGGKGKGGEVKTKNKSTACHVHLQKVQFQSWSCSLLNPEHTAPKLTPWLFCQSLSSCLLQQFCQDLLQ